MATTMAGPYTLGPHGGMPLTFYVYVHPVIPGAVNVAQFISNSAANVYDLANFFLNHPVDSGSACFHRFSAHILSGPVVIQILATALFLYSCYRAYCSFKEAVWDHLDAGKGGTPADAWG